jgi:purine-binding chemotaxis protein CheW
MGRHMHDDATRRILEDRARELARPMQSGEDEDASSLLILVVGDERYGIDINAVGETRPLAGLAPLPHAPPFWIGLVNVRGRLCPVLDLGRYLQVPESESPSLPAGDRRMLVVVAAVGLTVGLMVDAVGEIRRVPLRSVRRSAADSLGGAGTAILGVTDDLVSVLDVEAMLADPSLIVQGR